MRQSWRQEMARARQAIKKLGKTTGTTSPMQENSSRDPASTLRWRPHRPATDGWRYSATTGKQGVEVPGAIAGGFRSKHTDHGVLYADIYNVATGAKVIALSGAFQNRTVIDWFLTSTFLEDRYFFFNMTGPELDRRAESDGSQSANFRT